MTRPTPLLSFADIEHGIVPLDSAASYFDRVAVVKNGRFVLCAFSASSNDQALEKAAQLADEGLCADPLPITLHYRLHTFAASAEHLADALLVKRPGRVLVLTVRGREEVGVVALRKGANITLMNYLSQGGKLLPA